MLTEIRSHLPADFPPIHWFDSIGSTNTHAKQLAHEGAPQGTVVLADTQTGGRGRMGRSFLSPAGSGIYLSMILRPDCVAGELMHLTCAAGVAVCDAVEEVCGVRPGIKWINDLVLGEKKLGGILTELSVNNNGLADYAVVGIGINISHTPPAVKEMATCLWDAGIKADRASLIAAILTHLIRLPQTLLPCQEQIMAQYRTDCITLGKEICVIRNGSVRYGKALDVDLQGGLLVGYDDGTEEIVSSGEVSIRGMYGYV